MRLGNTRGARFRSSFPPDSPQSAQRRRRRSLPASRSQAEIASDNCSRQLSSCRFVPASRELNLPFIQTDSYLFRVAPQIIMLVVVRISRALKLRQRVFFQLLHHNLDGLIELGIASLTVSRRIEIYFVVRRDSVVLDFPLAVETVDRTAKSCNVATVYEFGITADADQPPQVLVPTS